MGNYITIYIQYWWQIHEIAAQQLWLAALTELTRERTHCSIQHRTHMVPSNTHTHWSVWVVSKVYYVLPTLRRCHLGTIMKPNSRNKWQICTNNVHGALCLLLPPRFPNMVVTWPRVTPKTPESCRRSPNSPDFYRTGRLLPWEIAEILNARFATQNSTGHGIKLVSHMDRVSWYIIPFWKH